ncbi:hypothetical protein GCM10010286_47640 [Streptomyces toxytricini]|nr:hypothetical protein GCM10010286_47640 [Streptomyces toxytricini]
MRVSHRALTAGLRPGPRAVAAGCGRGAATGVLSGLCPGPRASSAGGTVMAGLGLRGAALVGGVGWAVVPGGHGGVSGLCPGPRVSSAGGAVMAGLGLRGAVPVGGVGWAVVPGTAVLVFRGPAPQAPAGLERGLCRSGRGGGRLAAALVGPGR